MSHWLTAMVCLFSCVDGRAAVHSCSVKELFWAKKSSMKSFNSSTEFRPEKGDVVEVVIDIERGREASRRKAWSMPVDRLHVS